MFRWNMYIIMGTSKNPVANTERVIPENFIFDYRSLARDNRNEIYPESDLVFIIIFKQIAKSDSA